jgi:parallel beta-helix repeat protein
MVKGFTITNGYETHGGAIYMGGNPFTGHPAPTIVDNIIVGNDASSYGGGIHITWCSPTIQENTITGNWAPEGGGIVCAGINLIPLTSPQIIGNTISGNDSNKGGGVAIYNNIRVNLEGNTISDNYADQLGGGIYCNYIRATVNITNNTIAFNFGHYYGGGIYCYDTSTYPKITGNTIMENYAYALPGSGGGIACDYYSHPLIEENTILMNRCGTDGGGIYCQDHSSPTVRGNTIEANWTEFSNGGGICVTDYSSPGVEFNLILANDAAVDGGGLHCSNNSSPDVENNTFVLNIASSCGGGVCVAGASCSPAVVNCILWDNWAPVSAELHDAGGTCSVNFSDVAGGWPLGVGNLNANPMFVNPGINDYNLLFGSPCIDAGDPSYGVPKGGGRLIDMGAFEYWKGFNCHKTPVRR